MTNPTNDGRIEHPESLAGTERASSDPVDPQPAYVAPEVTSYEAISTVTAEQHFNFS